MEKQPAVVQSHSISIERRVHPASSFGYLALALGVLPLAIMMVGGGLFGMQKPDGWATFVGMSWLGAFGSLIASVVARLVTIPRSGSAQASEHGLTLRTARIDELVPRDRIESAVVVPGRRPKVALLLADRRTLTIATASVEEADSLVAALGLPQTSRRLVTSLRPSLVRALAGGVYLLALIVVGAMLKEKVGAMSPLVGGAWLAFALTAGAAWLLGTRAPEITVGADGLRVRGKLGSRFVPFARIESVRSDGGSLGVELVDGSSERFTAPFGNADDLAAVARRAEIALAAHATQPDAPARLALLERRGRPLGEWAKKIAELASGDEGYRSPPLSRSDLETILGAPGATAEHKLGAALGLRLVAQGDAAPKIRVAAEACASPRVRIALESVADASGGEEAGFDGAVEEALAAEVPESNLAPAAR